MFCVDKVSCYDLLDVLYTLNSLCMPVDISGPGPVEVDKTASVEYPFEDHRDLLMLVSCNVGRQRIFCVL